MMQPLKQLLGAAEQAIHILKVFIDVNTIFVATNDGTQNRIVKAFNRHIQIVKENSELPLMESLCSLVLKRNCEVVVIPDVSDAPETADLAIVRQLNACSFVGAPITTGDNKFYGTLCVMDGIKRDYTEREIALINAMARFIGSIVEVERLSIRDPLTGVYNRTYLNEIRYEHAQQVLPTTCIVMFVDLDNFKLINDTYGHDVGDALLVESVRRMATVLSEEDMIVRFGGDEFVIYSRRLRNDGEASEAGKRVAQALQEPHVLKGQRFQVSASVGVALSTPDQAVPLDTLLRQADLAMYAVKKDGKAACRLHRAGLEFSEGTGA